MPTAVTIDREMRLDIILIVKRRGLRCGSWNVRGLTIAKTQEIRDIVLKNQIDILAVQETCERMDSNGYRMDDFSYWGQPRRGIVEGRASGGVGIFLHNSLHFWIIWTANGAASLPKPPSLR